MLNDDCCMIGVGLDLMLSEHSSFHIPHFTFDRSTGRHMGMYEGYHN